MKTSLTLLMNIINGSNRLFGVEKAPLLISSATAIYLGIPVLHEVFKIFRAEILFQKQVRITFDVKSPNQLAILRPFFLRDARELQQQRKAWQRQLQNLGIRLSILFSQYRSRDNTQESIVFQSWTFTCSHSVFSKNTTKVQTF